MKLVIIESPYAGDILRNKAYAQAALRHSLSLGEAPIASHLLYTQILNDSIEKERAEGIEAGLSWMRVANLVAFYLDLGMSRGMQNAYETAIIYQIRIEKRIIPSFEEAIAYERSRTDLLR